MDIERQDEALAYMVKALAILDRGGMTLAACHLQNAIDLLDDDRAGEWPRSPPYSSFSANARA